MAGRPKGTRSLKNMLRADLVCQEDNIHPIRELIRIAKKAESAGDLHLASDNWQFIQEFCQAKPKPIEVDDANDAELIEESGYDADTLESAAEEAH